MLINVIQVIILASIIIYVRGSFRYGDEPEKEGKKKGLFGKIIAKAKEADAKSYVIGLVVGGAIMAVNNYLIPSFPEFAWAFFVLAVAFIVGLCYWWYKEGNDLGEFIAFTLLTLIVGFSGKAAAAVYGSVILSLIATLVPILAIAWFAVSAMYYRYSKNTEIKEKLLERDKEELADEYGAKAKKYAILTLTVMTVALAVVVFVSGTTLVSHRGDTSLDTSTVAAAAKDAAATTVSAEDGSDKDARFTQKWTENDENKIDSEFSEKLAKKAKKADGKITSGIVKDAVLENCGHDARQLAIWANALGMRDDPNKNEDLYTKDSEGNPEYLTDEGIELYNKVEGYLEAVTAEREEAPEDGINSGYNNGFVLAESVGITGDRSGTKFTCPNGCEFWLMDRCSNFVYRGRVPKAPTGPTDNPPGKGDNPPEPSGPTYDKNPSKAPKKNTEPNDDKGPGKKTIDQSGKDPNHSTEDANKKDGSSSSSTTAKSPADYNKSNSEAVKSGGDGGGGGNTGNHQQSGGSSDKSSTQPKETVKHDSDNGETVDNPF